MHKAFKLFRFLWSVSPRFIEGYVFMSIIYLHFHVTDIKYSCVMSAHVYSVVNFSSHPLGRSCVLPAGKGTGKASLPILVQVGSLGASSICKTFFHV